MSATPTRRWRPTRSPVSRGSTASDVYFLTGTDEHGIKMKQTAAREGLDAARARRPQHAAVPEDGRGARLLERRLHPHDRAAPLPRLARKSGGGWRRTATSTRTATPAGTRSATRPTTPSRRPRCGRTMSATGRRARRSSGSRRRATSSACRPIRTGCSPTTRRIPISSARTSAGTRWSASSRAGSGTCRSRARPSTGASRCRATRST